jgi:hypothetical protein
VLVLATSNITKAIGGFPPSAAPLPLCCRSSRVPSVLRVASHIARCNADVAFLDRADLKCYIGPPDDKARYPVAAPACRTTAQPCAIANCAAVHRTATCAAAVVGTAVRLAAQPVRRAACPPCGASRASACAAH